MEVMILLMISLRTMDVFWLILMFVNVGGEILMIKKTFMIIVT